MPTIALNMICGAGEAGLLDRCLLSMKAKDNFDEVVIAVTADDADVVAVAEKHATKVIRHTWACEQFPRGNFARARNAALDATTSDYVMWCDADDVVTDHHYDKFKALVDLVKSGEQNVDVYLCNYDLSPMPDGGSERCITKERVWRRCDMFRWQKAVHELILPFSAWESNTFTTGIAKNVYISHMPNKAPEASSTRNVEIMEAVYNSGERDDHTLYFYANDLLLLGRIDEAANITLELITRHTTSPENMYVSCVNLAQAYAYGTLLFRPDLQDFRVKNIDAVENWARLAQAMRPVYAEPYVMLGDVYQVRNEIDASGRMYKTAMTKVYGTGTNQVKPFYSELPARRLAELCYRFGDAEQALWYNKQCAAACSGFDCVERRQKILHRLISQKTTQGV